MEVLRILFLIGQILFSLAAVFLLCLIIKTYLIGPYHRKLRVESKGSKEILILGLSAFIFLMLTVILKYLWFIWPCVQFVSLKPGITSPSHLGSDWNIKVRSVYFIQFIPPWLSLFDHCQALCENMICECCMFLFAFRDCVCIFKNRCVFMKRHISILLS